MSLSEDKLKKIIASLTTLLCLVSFAGGYVSGMFGLWFTAPLLVVVYFIVIGKLGGGGHH